MWRRMMFLAAIFMVATPAMAQDVELVTFEGKAALNDTNQAAVTLRKVVDVLNPSVDTLYLIKSDDFGSGEWVYGVSASLYNIHSQDHKLGSVRIGYAMERGHRIYGGVRADLEGLAFRYLPELDSDNVLVRGLDGLLTLAASYTKLGTVAGWDIENEKFVWGPTIGGEVRF